jgi:hypothetical protein
VQFLPNDGLPEGAAGYEPDIGGHRRNQHLENLKKCVKIQKKVNKLTKKNKVIRRK